MPNESPLKNSTFHLVTSLDDAFAFKRWLGTVHENNTIAFDTETTGLSAYEPTAAIRLAQFGDMRDGWAIPWGDWRGLVLEALREWRGDLVMHHCFTGETRIHTRTGLERLGDLSGSKTEVWTRSGWMPASVEPFGTQPVQEITFRQTKSRYEQEVRFVATPEHRWFLRGGATTTALKPGDVVLAEIPDRPLDEESFAFKHGLIFADGTRQCKGARTKDGRMRFQMRLSGWKAMYAPLFDKVLYHASNHGAPQVYMKSVIDLKALPTTTDPDYIANFIAGWVKFDGTIRKNKATGDTVVVTTIRRDATEWLAKYAELGGWYVTGQSTHHKEDRSPGFGSGPMTWHMTGLTRSTKGRHWTVKSVVPLAEPRDVFCAVVPGEESFTLEHGVYTGNCKFDVNWVEEHSDFTFKREKLHDTMIQARIINPLGSGALKALSDEYIDRRASFGQRLLDDAFKEHKWDWRTVPIHFPPYWAYASCDTVITAHLHNMFYPRMRPGAEFAAVYDLEMATSNILGGMERRGARVDIEYAERKQVELVDYGQRVRAWGLAEHHISLGSMPQLARRFEVLGAEITERTATGQPKVDKYQLQLIADPENGHSSEARQLASRTLLMRQAEKTGNTYFRNFHEQAIDGLVHPSIHTIGARTGRMSISSPALQQCVDGATEVLTPEGWIRFDRLPDGVRIAQFDAETSNVTFVVPERIIRQPYSKPLHTLSLWGRTFAYTPDHRVISYVRDRKRGGLVTRVDDAATWHAELPVGGLNDRKFARAGHVTGGRRLTEPERASLRLAVIAQADGNLRTDMAKDAYEVSVSKLRKADALRACGIPLRTTFGKGKRPDRQRGWVLREQVSEWLDDSREKNFLSSILTLCEDDLRWFIDEILFWDGDFTRGVSYSQSVKRERSIDIVQAAAALCGYSTSSFYRDEGGGAIQLNLNQRSHRSYGKGTASSGYMRAPDGMVYCATVPTGAIITRREGLVLVTGNCPKRDATVRRAFIPREGNMLVTSDYNQIEMRMVAHFSGDRDLIGTFERADATGSDFFTEMGRLIYDPDFVKSDKRRGLIKNTLYGMAYGAGAAKMAESAGVPVSKMKDVIADIESRFPGIRGFMRMIEDQGIRRERTEGEGYVITPLGRRLACDPGKVYALTNYCLSPDTPILRSDLLHVPACDVKIGDRLVAFDEDPVKNVNPTSSGRSYSIRRWRTAIVEAVSVVIKPSLRVTLTDGRTLECSDDHQWLFTHRTRTQPRTRWVYARDLRVGDMLHSTGAPWNVDTSRDGGWLAGMYDGEGYLGTRPAGNATTNLMFSQLRGPVMDKFCREMSDRNLPYRYANASPNSTSPTDYCVTHSIPGIMRVLGTLQPERFKPRFESIYEGGALVGGSVDYVSVAAIERIGQQELISIQTSTRTLIANGILSHNCIQSTAADTFKSGLIRLDAAGYGDWMLLPVHDEIVLDIPKEHALEAVEEVPDILSDASMGVPITADADGPWTSWGEKYA